MLRPSAGTAWPCTGATGELRADLTDDEVADIVWAMNSADYYALLDRRGWTPERYGRHLADAWRRILLAGTRTPEP